MKKGIFVFIIGCISLFSAYAQLEVGAGLGFVVPYMESPKMFRSAMNSGIWVKYHHKSNFSMCAEVSFPGWMKLEEDWAVPQLEYSFEDVEYNTVFLKYDPLASLIIAYDLKTFENKIILSPGFGFGYFTSRIDGKINYASGGYDQIINLTRESKAAFAISPEFSLSYPFMEYLTIYSCLKYNFLFLEYQQHLLRLEFGLSLWI